MSWSMRTVNCIISNGWTTVSEPVTCELKNGNGTQSMPFQIRCESAQTKLQQVDIVDSVDRRVCMQRQLFGSHRGQEAQGNSLYLSQFWNSLRNYQRQPSSYLSTIVNSEASSSPNLHGRQGQSVFLLASKRLQSLETNSCAKPLLT